MNITYNENGWLEVPGNLKPKGKLITGRIAKSKRFFDDYRTYQLTVEANSTKLKVLDKKLQEEGITPELKKEYEDKALEIMKEKVSPPFFNAKKLTTMKFRVVGYTDVSTIVEPHDKRGMTKAIKMGYYPEIVEE